MNSNVLDKLKARVLTCISNNNLNRALVLIKDFVEIIIRNPDSAGVLLCVPLLDELCLKIGEQTRLAVKANKATANIYIATELYMSGGHTAVIEDFIRAQPNDEHVILMTDIFGTAEKESIQNRFSTLPVTLNFLAGKGLHEKLILLQEKWLALQPKKVFLFNHPHDPVIIAAAQPDMPGKLYFYHHVDFKLSLGVSLTHALHIDCNPLMYQCCKNNIYLPLVCEDLTIHSLSANHCFMKNGVINTASSGSAGKFLHPYAYRYSELIPEILKQTGGYHVHIGVLPWRARRKLLKNKKFIYIPWTKSVWAALREHQIDLYITSFPIGGGRTAIEVMGAGVPMLGHLNHHSVFLSENKLLYPDAFLWKTPDALLAVLKKLTPEKLKLHARLAREHYEAYYQPSVLIKWFLDESSWPKIPPHEALGKTEPNTLLNQYHKKTTRYYILYLKIKCRRMIKKLLRLRIGI